MAYAHTHSDPAVQWKILEDHLLEVAQGTEHTTGARQFAARFGCTDLGDLAGRWHDLGKYSSRFQQHLQRSHRGLPSSGGDHSLAGAVHALGSSLPLIAKVALVFSIAGHHAGLADGDCYGQTWSRQPLSNRLENRNDVKEAISMAPEGIKEVGPLNLPDWAVGSVSPFACALLCRMVFSCLVDADRLAAEHFGSPERSALRKVTHPSMSQLLQALNVRINRFATSTTDDAPISRARAQLLQACRDASQRAPGLFTLTAPTGTGKTLSSMAFALSHAAKHGHERIIYAMPFTSVTEQCAREFRSAFASLGSEIVLEHHSAYSNDASPDTALNLTDDARAELELSRELTAENWNAPVVVTTNVQFLESLFATETKRCRKLHSVARSVIVLDEAQALPVDLLAPTLAALRELVDHYGVTIVFCSATMPALLKRDDFPIGLEPSRVSEIVPNPSAMAASVKRTIVQKIGSLSNEKLIEHIVRHNQSLTIVNTRRHAAELFTLLRMECPSALHLSASMCPQHRADVVREIKRRLKQHLPCHVVSTQVVEAGVDIDFPVVFRAFAGIDSIVQAAGRCNREGRLPMGDVFVFDPLPEESGTLPPEITHSIASAREALAEKKSELDNKTIEAFFRLHVWRNGGREPKWDGPPFARGFGGVTGLLSKLRFESADRAFKMITEATESVVVPYQQTGSELCKELFECHTYNVERRRKLFRDSQRYTVGVHESVSRTMLRDVLVMRTECGLLVAANEAHDENLGIRSDALFDPARGIV